jgi:hypothetical protein
MLADEWYLLIWAHILYFHTAFNVLEHKGHCIRTLVHGDFWVNFDVLTSDIFLRFGQQEFTISILLLVFAYFTRWITHNVPVSKQSPHELSESLSCELCRMWLPMCQRSSGPLMFTIGVSKHCLHHCSSGLRCVLESASHTKQAASIA